jgi:hypothetical protein
MHVSGMFFWIVNTLIVPYRKSHLNFTLGTPSPDDLFHLTSDLRVDFILEMALATSRWFLLRTAHWGAVIGAVGALCPAVVEVAFASCHLQILLAPDMQAHLRLARCNYPVAHATDKTKRIACREIALLRATSVGRWG